MKGLGNAGIGDGGGLRIHRPADAAQLLKLVVDEHERRRRIIFFCSCGELEGCHRNEVRELVLKEARAEKVALQIAEWPGGEPEKALVCTLKLPVKELTRIFDGATRIPITEELALTTFAAVPTGSYVEITDGDRRAIITVRSARYSAGKWFIEPFLLPVLEDVEIADLAKDLARNRRESGYTVFTAQ